MPKSFYVALTLQLKIKSHNKPQHLPTIQAQKKPPSAWWWSCLISWSVAARDLFIRALGGGSGYCLPFTGCFLVIPSSGWGLGWPTCGSILVPPARSFICSFEVVTTTRLLHPQKQFTGLTFGAYAYPNPGEQRRTLWPGDRWVVFLLISLIRLGVSNEQWTLFRRYVPMLKLQVIQRIT